VIEFGMYRHVPPCTAINRERHSMRTYFLVFFLYQYVPVRTGMYINAKTSKSTYWYVLYTRKSTYRYVQVRTSINVQHSRRGAWWCIAGKGAGKGGRGGDSWPAVGTAGLSPNRAIQFAGRSRYERYIRSNCSDAIAVTCGFHAMDPAMFELGAFDGRCIEPGFTA
jgi:hypothetical protein